MKSKKYYGGPLYYYIDASSKNNTQFSDSKKLYDILRDEYKSKIMQADYEDELSQALFDGTKSITINGETRVSNSYSYIRRKAFGYNNDNTCSAVAVGIALNYLTSQTGKPFVLSTLRSETYNNGRPISAASNASSYPKAHGLHRQLVNTHGMGAVSYAEGIRIPFNSYVSTTIPSSYGLSMSWTLLPKTTTIKSNINANKPVLITTTVAGDYSWHTMVAYGYRETSGSTELLVHTGWYTSSYNSPVSGSITNFVHNEIWISKNYATYGYYFFYN